jgi:hypothetical protein
MTEVKREKAGRYAPGTSGNPAGRPKQATTALKRQLAEHGSELVEKAVELALAGDTTALKICLDRISPALKPSAERIRVDVPTEGSLSDTARAFIHAAADGRLPGDLAAQLIVAVGATARVVEVDDLQRRLEALEATQK